MDFVPYYVRPRYLSLYRHDSRRHGRCACRRVSDGLCQRTGQPQLCRGRRLFQPNHSVTITSDTNGINGFKSGSAYGVTIAFYDRFRRKCGVVHQYVSINIPERDNAPATWATQIAWALSNSYAASEIPAWAYYYQLHISRNLTKAAYVQSVTDTIKFVTKDVVTGELTYSDSVSMTQPLYGIAIDLTFLASYGYGYTYDAANGDIAILIDAHNNKVYYRVIGQDGSYVILAGVGRH
jgi:hypothetical protein